MSSEWQSRVLSLLRLMTGLVLLQYGLQKMFGLIPGGPYASFPLVLTFLKAGAGPAQMVALITSWAVLAFHRVVMWEVPVLGARFALIRTLASVGLPLLAGLLAFGGLWLLAFRGGTGA